MNDVSEVNEVRVVAVTAELMAATRVDAVLRGCGCPVTCVEPEPDAVRAAMVPGVAAVMVLDLAVAGAVQEVAFAAAQAAGAKVVAFGSHVDRGVLEAARQRGADVLTRGAVTQGLAPLVAKYLARRTPPDMATEPGS